MNELAIDSIIDEHGNILLGLACRCGSTFPFIISHERQVDLVAAGLTSLDVALDIVEKLNAGLLRCDACQTAETN